MLNLPSDSIAMPDMLPPAIEVEPIVACWRDIGIKGDRTCPELAAVIHCHNCPTYTKTARQLFERPQPELNAPSLSTSNVINPQFVYAQFNAQNTRSSDEVKTASLAIFRLEESWFSLPANLFQQVVTTRTIRPIPHRSNDILQGLVNVQGELLLCVNLKNLLNLERPKNVHETQLTKQKTLPRLVIVQWDDDRWSFTVDEFQGIESIEADQLITPPTTVLQDKNTFTHSLLPWNKHNINCLDEFLLFEALERTALA